MPIVLFALSIGPSNDWNSKFNLLDGCQQVVTGIRLLAAGKTKTAHCLTPFSSNSTGELKLFKIIYLPLTSILCPFEIWIQWIPNFGIRKRVCYY